ncbi:hypothetical protein WN55_04004 [Dufourea novaeangliae]|uniref:Uncharacterized protein n=1 Tax=Dufourea novaeangliae TaxID=178035 RepID=A0A154PKT5_DUFNO|nr:hypothetical protein WN55_04004 [Dufourea novaeangliae]
MSIFFLLFATRLYLLLVRLFCSRAKHTLVKAPSHYRLTKLFLLQERKDINTVTTTQIILCLLFVFGTFFVLIMYCKACTRYSDQSRRQSGHNDEDRDTSSLQCYTIFESRARPPSYSEACSAPPLYGSPLNKASMLEGPPVYPDTPKLTDKVSQQCNRDVSLAHHI